MKKHYIQLGPGVRMDIDVLVRTRLLVQANSGGGKSYTIRRILEQSHGYIQQIVLDVEGEFHTLRDKFDYIYASAGRGGDCFVTVHAAELMARRFLELKISAIVDIYEMKARDRVLFVKNFLDALVNAPKELWHPVLIVVDEAHVFCPEKGEAVSASAVIDLMTRGRKRGFCGMLATQRLSKLHKDAAAEANNKLIGRSSLDVDMKRAGDELGFRTRAELLSLRALKAGEFYAFGPAVSDNVERVRIGPVETHHPEPGKAETHVAAPRETVQKILAQISDLPAEAAEEARTVSELQRRVRELESQVKRGTFHVEAGMDEIAVSVDGKQKTFYSPERVEKVAADAREKARTAFAQETERQNAHTLRTVAELDGIFAKASAKMAELRQSLAPGEAPLKVSVPERQVSTNVVAVPRPRPEPAARPKATSNGHLPGPEQRILDGIAWVMTAGLAQPHNEIVAFAAGYRPTSSSYTNPRGSLKSKGLIDYPAANKVALTTEGAAQAHHPDSPVSAEELQKRVLDKLPGPESKILRALIAAYPNEMSNEDCAAESGYSANSSSYTNPRGSLRSLGLIDYPRPGEVKACAFLFLKQP